MEGSNLGSTDSSKHSLDPLPPLWRKVILGAMLLGGIALSVAYFLEEAEKDKEVRKRIYDFE